MSKKNLLDADEALNFIPPDQRDLCIKVGMALKTEFGEEAYPLWDSWLQTGRNYNKEDMRRAWLSFKPSGAIKLGTIFYLAKENGFEFARGRKSYGG